MNKLFVLQTILILSINFLFGRENNYFSTVNLQLYVNTYYNSGFLEKYYSIDDGGGLKMSSPFYIGELEMNVTANHIKHSQSDQNNYYGIFATAEWILPVNISNKLIVYPGVGAGNYFMMFYNKTHEEKIESEVCLSFIAGIRYKLNDNFSLMGGYTKKEISTFHKIYLSELMFGMAFTFNTPHFLRVFLE